MSTRPVVASSGSSTKRTRIAPQNKPNGIAVRYRLVVLFNGRSVFFFESSEPAGDADQADDGSDDHDEESGIPMLSMRATDDENGRSKGHDGCANELVALMLK